MSRYSLPALAAGLLLVGAGGADDEKKAPTAADAKSFEVPYKFTAAKHIVVRVKINGKGPFNFILDTGAPSMHVATPVGKKAGLKSDANSWAVIDTLAIEGGIKMAKVKAHVETPFQLEGMNGLGLAGLEIHGLMGYTVVAKYRLEIDFTRDKLVWTEIPDYEPKLERIGGKGKGGTDGLNVMGSVMKGLGGLLGRKPAPPVVLRGFFGLTLDEGDGNPVVKGVLEKGPAGLAGVRVDDVITKVNGRTVSQPVDVLRVLRNGDKLSAGGEVELTVKRGDETKTVTFKTAEGI